MTLNTREHSRAHTYACTQANTGTRTLKENMPSGMLDLHCDELSLKKSISGHAGSLQNIMKYICILMLHNNNKKKY